MIEEYKNNIFGITNDPQITDLIEEIDMILRMFNVHITIIYKGRKSIVYEINKLNHAE